MQEELPSNGYFEYEFLDECARLLDGGVMTLVGEYEGEMMHLPAALFEYLEGTAGSGDAKESIVKYRDAARTAFELADDFSPEADRNNVYFAKDVNPFRYPGYFYTWMVIIGIACILLQCRGVAESTNGDYPVTPAWYDPGFRVTPWTVLSLRAFLMAPANYAMADAEVLRNSL